MSHVRGRVKSPTLPRYTWIVGFISLEQTSFLKVPFVKKKRINKLYHAGALASIINTLEHGGQVGMVFEMYRSSAGFFRLMQETIKSNIGERNVERRENGEVLKLKVALQLGRSLSELEHLAALYSSRNGQAVEEFASKLF
jgi:hypothetical protein